LDGQSGREPITFKVKADRDRSAATLGVVSCRRYVANLDNVLTVPRHRLKRLMGAFLLGTPPAELAKEFHALPIKREILEKWSWRNAAALLSIPMSGGGD